MQYMNSNCTSCRNSRRDEGFENMPLAMAYVPWQNWDNIYDLDKGFRVGTIFPCLDKPFMGRCACK